MRFRTNEHPEHAYLTAGDPGALHVVGCMQNDCPLINLPFQLSIGLGKLAVAAMTALCSSACVKTMWDSKCEMKSMRSTSFVLHLWWLRFKHLEMNYQPSQPHKPMAFYIVNISGAKVILTVTNAARLTISNFDIHALITSLESIWLFFAQL